MHFGWFDSAHHKSAQCKQRGSALLIILLIAAVLVISGMVIYRNLTPGSVDSPSVGLSKIFNSPKPSPSAAIDMLKTYTDKNSEFEFRYPKELEVKEDNEADFDTRGNGNFRKNFSSYVGYEPGKVLEAVAVLGKDNNFNTAPFSVWVFENLNGLDEQGWYKRYWYYPFLWGDFDAATNVHVFPNDVATVSGQLAKSAVIYYQPGKPKIVLLGREEKIFLFKTFTDSNESSIGEQILASFKLLK